MLSCTRYCSVSRSSVPSVPSIDITWPLSTTSAWAKRLSKSVCWAFTAGMSKQSSAGSIKSLAGGFIGIARYLAVLKLLPTVWVLPKAGILSKKNSIEERKLNLAQMSDRAVPPRFWQYLVVVSFYSQLLSDSFVVLKIFTASYTLSYSAGKPSLAFPLSINSISA